MQRHSYTFLLYRKNAIVAIAFEISSFYSETQIGEKKSMAKPLFLVLLLDIKIK